MVPITQLFLALFLLCLATLSSAASQYSVVSFTFYLTPYTYFDYLTEKSIADKLLKKSIRKSLQISSISDFKISHSSSTSNTIYPVRKLSTSSLVRVTFSHKVLSSKASALATSFETSINNGSFIDVSTLPGVSSKLGSSSTINPSYNTVQYKNDDDSHVGQDTVAGAIWGSILSAIFLYSCFCVYRKYYKSDGEFI